MSRAGLQDSQIGSLNGPVLLNFNNMGKGSDDIKSIMWVGLKGSHILVQ